MNLQILSQIVNNIQKPLKIRSNSAKFTQEIHEHLLSTKDV